MVRFLVLGFLYQTLSSINTQSYRAVRAVLWQSLMLAGIASAVLVSCVSRSASYAIATEQQSTIDETESTTYTPTITKTPAPTPTETAQAPEIDYTAVRPYEVGQIMIMMYHGLVETEADEKSYMRTADNFKNDLQTFYDRGFRLVSMKDWFNNNIDIPAGYTPLILTFDDGMPTTFSLENRDGELRPVKGCMVDILSEFSEKHPDFGNMAMFFISKNPFVGEGTLAERFKYLLDRGYEIGNHTMNHKSMSGMSPDEIQAELGMIDKLIKENAPGYEPYAFCYPYGIHPDESLYKYILNGEWEGGSYQHKIAVSVGQGGPPAAINRVGFDPVNVPRVRASDNEETDMGWMLRQYETKPELRYISDGNPNRIAVPIEYAENVDRDSLNGKELYLY